MLHLFLVLLVIEVNCIPSVDGQKHYCYPLVLWHRHCLFKDLKNCESSSIFIELLNLFVEFGIDKGLIWIKFSGKALLLPVVTCSVEFTECCCTANVVLGDEEFQFVWLCMLTRPITLPIATVQSIVIKMKKWEIYIFKFLFILEIFLFRFN